MATYKPREELESLKKEQSIIKNIPKHVVMRKLKHCKKRLLNDQTKTNRNIDISLDTSLAVEFPRKTPGTKDPPEVQERREDMVNLIQELMDHVEYKPDEIMVVKVKTPAVDLDRSFDSLQLDFMKDEIFKGMKTKLGDEIEQTHFNEIKTQWENAFQVITNIVNIEKTKSQSVLETPSVD